MDQEKEKYIQYQHFHLNIVLSNVTNTVRQQQQQKSIRMQERKLILFIDNVIVLKNKKRQIITIELRNLLIFFFKY